MVHNTMFYYLQQWRYHKNESHN